MKRVFILAIIASSLTGCAYESRSTYSTVDKTNDQICFDYGRYHELNTQYPNSDFTAVVADLDHEIDKRDIKGTMQCSQRSSDASNGVLTLLANDPAFKSKIIARQQATQERDRQEQQAAYIQSMRDTQTAMVINQVATQYNQQLQQQQAERDQQFRDMQAQQDRLTQQMQQAEMNRNLNRIANSLSGNRF